MSDYTRGPWRWKGAALLGPRHRDRDFDDAIARCLGNMTPAPPDMILIASAPELLEAAQYILTHDGDPDGIIRLNRVVMAALGRPVTAT